MRLVEAKVYDVYRVCLVIAVEQWRSYRLSPHRSGVVASVTDKSALRYSIYKVPYALTCQRQFWMPSRMPPMRKYTEDVPGPGSYLGILPYRDFTFSYPYLESF